MRSLLTAEDTVGIYTRDYWREGNNRNQGGFFDGGIPPTVKGLLIANVIVFVLQMLITKPLTVADLIRSDPQYDRMFKDIEEEQGPEAAARFKEEYERSLRDLDMPFGVETMRTSVVQDWFELDTDKVMHGQVWRLLTAAFCHDRQSIWHIVFNMLALYLFGCTLELMYGSREFLFFYLAAALASSLAFVGLDLYTGSRIPAIGASGAVMGVFMVYTLFYPRHEILVFWLIPVQVRWLLLGYLIYDLHPVLQALGGDGVNDGVGHAAHLGGLAFGFLYYKQQWRLEKLIDWSDGKKSIRTSRRRPALKVYEEPEIDDAERVDALLKKITEEGKESLTEEENEFLRAASTRMKKQQE